MKTTSVRISVSQSVIYTFGRQRKASPTGAHLVRGGLRDPTQAIRPRGHLRSCVVVNPSVTRQPAGAVATLIKTV